MSSFSAALGLDAPVEVVNARVSPERSFARSERACLPVGADSVRGGACLACLTSPHCRQRSQELEGLARMGVVFYGINLGVGISIALPGFASDLAHGLLGEMPFGAISLVGCKRLEDARTARLSGADAVLVKREMWQAAEAEGISLEVLLQQVRAVTDGDD